MGTTPEGGDRGPGLGQGGWGRAGVASGEGLVAGMKRDGEEREDDFWAAGLLEGGFELGSLVAEAGLGAGMKPGGGAKDVGLGAGMKPTTGGRDGGLE